MRQNTESTRIIREVIDGQQRLRAVLEYIDGKYALAKSVDGYGGYKFTNLSTEPQEQILSFPRYSRW